MNKITFSHGIRLGARFFVFSCFLALVFAHCSEDQGAQQKQASNEDSPVEIVYSDKEKVVCASSETSSENCSAHLPLVVYDSSERFSVSLERSERFFRPAPLDAYNGDGVPPQKDKYLLRIDGKGSALFPQGERLSYEIISGNPYCRITGRLKHRKICSVDDCPPAYVDMYAYRIDNEGKLYTKDVWLLGRNSYDYARDASQAEELIFGLHNTFLSGDGRMLSIIGSKYRGRMIAAGSCPVDTQGKADCSDQHGLYISYTFARTQTDTLKIRVTDMDSGESKEIEARIKPHPHSIALAYKCLSEEDSLRRWACVNAAELIPESEIKIRDEDKEKLQSSLPNGLAFAKSEYDLVHAVEFNSLAEAKRTFPFLRLSDKLQIRDGKLIHKFEVEPIAGRTGKCRFKPKQTGDSLHAKSTGRFEPGAGYLEYGFAKYPFQRGYDGNVIIWSRYGSGHNAFGLVPPYGIFTGRDSVSRQDLGKIGYMELDFMERWVRMTDVYAVIHTYPLPSLPSLASEELYPGGPSVSTSKGYGYLIWPKGEAVGDGTGYAIKKGIEIAPGHFPSDRGVRFFVNGSSIALKDNAVNNYLQGAAYLIGTMGYIDSGEVDCDEIHSTSTELDYIRYYKPRSGY